MADVEGSSAFQPRGDHSGAVGDIGPVVGNRPPPYDLSYRDQFWATRTYEDGCDRIALRALLPAAGGHLLDLGAGFGRLSDEYAAFERVTLVDASPEMIAAARERVGRDPRFSVIQAEASSVPIGDGTVDVIVAVRLMVHLRDPEPVLAEIARILRPGGLLILEFANRDHLLARVRHVIHRQFSARPDPVPFEYRPSHFAHRRATVERQLRDAGLVPTSRRAVSLFRTPWLKRLVGSRFLWWLEARLQARLAPLDLSPSVHIAARLPE